MMKVYTLPDEVPAPKVDYMNFDLKKMRVDEDAHKAALKDWLIKQGYTGKRTGQIVQFGVADGYALYMLAEGSKSCLIHLPYGDAYQYFGVEHMPKKQIISLLESQESMKRLFKIH